MRIGSGTDFIDIDELERGEPGLPGAGDLRVSVQVRLGEFSGRYDAVWLDGDTLREFTEQFKQLERDRTGSVTLASSSPNEFALNIRALDKLGHFVAEVSLSRYRYVDGMRWPATVSGSVEIEPTSLPSLLDAFNSLCVPDQAPPLHGS